ncbi:hypothetical protein [Curtobacterium oceanosedimentum]|uniref:hypothetical protein n=1 Tax=Curtobacterium oceanosedimentum TaxID=465820 RepID=UPI003390AFF7
MSARQWTLEFEWERPLLSANDRYGWRERHQRTRLARTSARLKAWQAHIPALDKVHVHLVWQVADRRRRDGNENLAPTLKALIDGIVDAGVVPDDTPNLVERSSPAIEYLGPGHAKRDQRVLLVVTEVDA